MTTIKDLEVYNNNLTEQIKAGKITPSEASRLQSEKASEVFKNKTQDIIK